MGIVDSDLLFSWSSLFSVGAMLFVLTAGAISLFVAARPKWFWLMLIIGGIVGCGPRISGYFFLDEIISGAAVLGALMRIAMLRSLKPLTPVAKSAHRTLFSLWIGYMIMESVLGVVYNNDFRIIRWVLFYAMLGVISAITYYRSTQFPFPSFRHLCLVVVTVTSVLYAVYLGQGMYFESILGAHGRFLSQDMIWAGSAYAVFPTLIAGPATIFILNDESRIVRLLAWVSIALMMSIALYYDSRISWLVLLCYFIAGMRKINVRNLVLVLALFGLSFSLYTREPLRQIGELGQSILEASQALWAPGRSDVSRNLNLQVGFMRITDNPKSFFIGDGVYSHRFTGIPYVEELYSKYLPNQDFVIPGSRDDSRGLEIWRTVGFTALLIDTGLIGMFLFGINWVFVALKLVRARVSSKALFLSMLGMSFMWLLSNNITDISLLYLLIMPQGLIDRWSRGDIAGKVANREVAIVGARH